MMESFDGEPTEVPLSEGDVESGPVASDPLSTVKNEDGTGSTTAATNSLHNAVATLAGIPKEDIKKQSAPETETFITGSKVQQISFPAEDDDMGEASEVFADEPEDLTPRSKQGRRIRGKLPTVSFSSPATQTSYWSSDDDNTPNARSRDGKMTKRKLSPFTGRPIKSRNKRRSRRQQEAESDSSSDEGPQLTQRKASPAPKSIPKPPIVVVRTKNKAKALGVPTSINSNQTNTTTTNSPIPTKARLSPAPPIQHLSIEDMEICQRLDDEYENALEERHIGYMARYTSVRQAACLSVVFMLIFLMLGTTFFMRYADWTIHDSLLFSIYTITTVGYGNHAIPKESGFQTFTILYIFVGIAMLTIMVAQVYQCIALEASRAQHARDKSEMARRGLGPNVLSRRSLHQQQNQSSQASTTSSVTHEAGNYFWEELECFDVTMHYYEKARHFFTHNEYGRSFSVLLPFAGLVLIGAIVVGPLEDWNVIESLYFAVVSLTTVGFGDYYPRHVISVWFCIFWLPFSVGFMSMFLKNVATFYIRLSAQNINRIERRMRRRVARAKEQLEFERAEALKRAYQYQQNQPAELELQRFPSVDSDDNKPTGNKRVSPSSSQTSRHSGNAARVGRRQGSRSPHFNALPTAPEDSVATPVVKASRASLFGSPGEDDNVINRRERILRNSLGGNQDYGRPKGQTMDTMKDLLEAVHKSIASGSSNSQYLSMRSSVMKPVLGDSNEPMRKPSFALRALVQERFSEIIATDIAGYQSSIEIKDNTLSVTIDLRETAEKWLIPRRARKAFRAVAFEALYFVGEHGLITKGADALFALSPFEFNGLFSPLLAALGDAGTMEDWLASTQVLAEVDLKNKDSDDRRKGHEELGEKTGYRTTEERLHTARHRNKSDTSNSIERLAIFETTMDC